VPPAATDTIELGVGLACLGLAVPLWRGRGSARWLAVVLAIAGAAAVARAVWSLVHG
jgi:hypothetical protein